VGLMGKGAFRRVLSTMRLQSRNKVSWAAHLWSRKKLMLSRFSCSDSMCG
jgi:hypothetical protein